MPRVLAGGAFQILHPGHVELLRRAARYGRLTVVIAHDRTVRATKGRVVVPAADRARAVAALRFVHRVVIGHPADRLRIVRRLRPDVIVLGPDQRMPGLAALCAEQGCRIVRVKRYRSYRTRRLAARLSRTR